MRTLRCALYGIALAATLFAQRPVPVRPVQPQIQFKDLMSWLPTDTETIIGSNGPFQVPHTDHEFDELTPEALRLAVLNQPLTLLGLDDVGLSGILKTETVTLAIEGSRHFRSPTHLGPMLFEGCEIAVFARDVSPRRDSFMKHVKESGAEIQQIEGSAVAELKVGIEDDTWNILVAFPKPRVVLVATNSGYLREVLRRMRGGTGPRALPDSLPEWKYVSTSGPLWALRHFDKSNQIDEDPSTPFRGWRAANVPDSDAIGVAAYLEPFSRQMAHVTYLSGRRAREVLQLALSSASSEPEDISAPATALKDLAPGVVAASIPLNFPKAANYLWFLLSGRLLGHATYL
jgi:hypothetical protein